MISITLVAGILAAFSAKRKGYDPYIWFFAWGLIRYAVLAFLPDTTPLMGRERPNAEADRIRGNRLGRYLIVAWLGSILAVYLYFGILF